MSQAMVGTGIGSGSVSAQSGRQWSSGPRCTVQISSAGAKCASSSVSGSRWTSASAQVSSNWLRSSARGVVDTRPSVPPVGCPGNGISADSVFDCRDAKLFADDRPGCAGADKWSPTPTVAGEQSHW
nr:hypothetical protein [Nocardia farcinica]